MTDAEAVAVLELLTDGTPDGELEDALALLLAAYAERRRAHKDLEAINRVRARALEIAQCRRVAA